MHSHSMAETLVPAKVRPPGPFRSTRLACRGWVEAWFSEIMPALLPLQVQSP